MLFPSRIRHMPKKHAENKHLKYVDSAEYTSQIRITKLVRKHLSKDWNSRRAASSAETLSSKHCGSPKY